MKKRKDEEEREERAALCCPRLPLCFDLRSNVPQGQEYDNNPSETLLRSSNDLRDTPRESPPAEIPHPSPPPPSSPRLPSATSPHP